MILDTDQEAININKGSCIHVSVVIIHRNHLTLLKFESKLICFDFRSQRDYVSRLKNTPRVHQQKNEKFKLITVWRRNPLY